MKLINEDSYLLNTGKIIHPNNGIIGLSETGNEYQIFEGYDGSWQIEKDIIYDGSPFNESDIELTNDELREIAIYMSKLWSKWAKQLDKSKK